VRGRKPDREKKRNSGEKGIGGPFFEKAIPGCLFPQNCQ
jgi:hypothetical protein